MPPAVFGNVPVVNALVDVAYIAPPEVKEVKFVPPFVVANVPARVTTPVVEVEGVSPVVPALKEDTAAVLAILTKSEPFHAQTADSFATMVTPVVGPAPTSLMDWVLPVLLWTT